MPPISAALLLALVIAASPTAARADCIPDWSVAAPIVHKEGLTTVEALSRLAAGELPGVIVKATLCEEGGGFVYRIVLREASGRLSSRTLDARAPFKR